MAARYRQRLARSRRRGALSHAEALATGDAFTWNRSTSQTHFCFYPYTSLSFLIADFRELDAAPKVVRVQDLLHSLHRMAGDRGDLRHRAVRQCEARNSSAAQIVEVQVL